MSALDKVLSLASPGTEPASQGEDTAELVLALSTALNGLCVHLASSDSDDDGDDDSGGGDSDDDSGHSDHGTYKALIKKGVKPAMAAKMCARSDKKVAASALAESACVILAGLTEPDVAPEQEPTYLGRLVALAAPSGESADERRKSAEKGHALPDGSYPIPDKKHLHSAAVLAASKKGNWKAAQALIRKRARELGVELSSLPGFGGDKGSATMVALAAGKMKGQAAEAHAPFHGVHTHAHVHAGDNMHGPASDRMPRESGYGY
jgi:hypothetical protein